MDRSVRVLAILCLLSIDCGRSNEPTAVAQPQSPAAPSTSNPASPGPVQIEMKDVMLHMDEGVVLHVNSLRGEMMPVKQGTPPVFDEPRSYVLRVSAAEMTMAMSSLTSLLNDHVFADEHAPLSDITVKVEEGRLKQKGTLHKGVSLPFSMEATVSAAPDGRLRMHAESAGVLGIPTKKIMEIFGLTLDDVVKIKDQRGVEIQGDDVLIDAGRVLPPPTIQGKLTSVDIANGRLNLRMAASGGKTDAPLAPADSKARHYVYFAGNQIRFGKLLMSNADLQLIDADERDPFDFFPERYNTQLVAGYSKNTPSGGLRTYMPDFNDVTPATDLRPASR
jgi:hypothetical protein